MSQKSIIILGIESSCDDTSAAVLKEAKILSNIIANQEIHKSYGGVVPELASRAHQQNIVPVVNEALKIANIKKEELDAIAFTRGPGLLGSLLVGTSFAKSLSLALNIPLIDVNHMHGHVMAHFIDEGKKMPTFPFLCLTVSGGHTQIVLVKSYFDMEVIGETLDDAAGEAFDKSAKILGLEYPGGPLIDKYAKQGNQEAFKFTKPRVGNIEFSFSGLKSNILQVIQRASQKNPDFIKDNLYDLCASIQYTIISILLEKIDNAVKKTGITQIAIAGGVSANSGLRNALIEREKTHKWSVFIPKFEYCTDNAAMIAISGYYKFQDEQFANSSVSANARMKL
ncbi:MAG: tRNA (adenosine(37)-N6)-threonylcarbamoyltransferase complex transferase subunit TsaD [Bacteroidetes bacterium MED-G21]|nr:MAG: tRNA (adenosine(37)-N6)-threonylcarbamoyltransferase complex transferase subunit TsaD [Bacteroidetes bacterium MED-G21]